MYRLISGILGLAVDVFYRRRHGGGAVPREGPVLLVANHPNALVDAVVLARVAKRRVRALAKEPLFRMPVISWLVKGAGALPVYRAKDGADTAKNDETFRAVFDSLAAGDCVALFPEGISHHLPSLQPLKTGAARLALGAERLHGGRLGVRVVPVGLYYDDKGTFRSELFVEVGEPLCASDFQGGDDARPLTSAIAERIRAVTLNLDEWDDKPLIMLAERIWPDDEKRMARARAIADGARALKERDPERYAELRARVQRFARWLDDVGLTADDLSRSLSALAVARFLARNLVALTLGLAFALAGALAYLAPYLAVDVVARRVTGGKADELATVKVLAGILLYPPWHLVLACALVYALGWPLGLGGSIAFPFAALYAEHFARRRRRAWHDAVSFFRLKEGSVRERLELERDALRAEMESVAKEQSVAPQPQLTV